MTKSLEPKMAMMEDDRPVTRMLLRALFYGLVLIVGLAVLGPLGFGADKLLVKWFTGH